MSWMITERAIAYNGGALIGSAAGHAYAETDTSYTAALPTTDLNGVALASIMSDLNGVIPQVRVDVPDGSVHVIWKFGSYVTAIPLLRALTDAATSAASLAAIASAAASDAAAAAIAAAEGPTDAAVDEGINRAILDGRITTTADWSTIANKPTVFAPIVGTTADTAFPGNGNLDSRYYTKTEFGGQVMTAAPNYYVLRGYLTARNHPRTGVPLLASDVVEWEVYESDPAPVNGINGDRRFDVPDVATQPALTIVGTPAAYSPSTSATTRNITLPTGITTGDVIYVAVSCPGSTNTITTPSGYTLVTNSATTGINAYLFKKENASGADSGATVTIASSTSLHVAAVAFALRHAPTSATVDGQAIATTASATSLTTGTRTSGANTVEIAIIFRTGVINSGLVTVPGITWTKLVEAADTTTNGGGAAVTVGYESLTSTPSGTAQGGDAWTWTGSASASASAWTVSVKAV